MALTEADIEQFIAELQANPQLRDRVRDAILAHDFLALPGIVERLGERVEQLGERIEDLTVQMQQLTLRMDRVDGRLGNLEGESYEIKYVLNLGSHLSPLLRAPRRLFAAELPEISDAFDAGRISRDEWNELHDLDVLAKGRLRQASKDAPEQFFAIELSRVVDRYDVHRAARRAALLSAHGVDAVALVDGDAITVGAQQLAQELGVTVLVRKVQPAA